jgi:hypothetical protein
MWYGLGAVLRSFRSAAGGRVLRLVDFHDGFLRPGQAGGLKIRRWWSGDSMMRTLVLVTLALAIHSAYGAESITVKQLEQKLATPAPTVSDHSEAHPIFHKNHIYVYSVISEAARNSRCWSTVSLTCFRG